MATGTDIAVYADALAERVEAVLPGWVVAAVERVAAADAPTRAVDPAVLAAAADAGRRAATEVGGALRALLAQDVDEQTSNPLAVLRRAVAYPTAVLHDAGVRPVARSDFDRRAFPDDDYGLTPATWADVDPSLQEPGVVWGAAKAHVVLSRRREEGLR